MKQYIAVEGNIGSGKSELLQKIQKHYGDAVACRKEPQKEWKCSGNNKDCRYNLLDLFYQDTKRWAFTFQVKCCMTRISDYKKSQKKITFGERSWTSDRHVFVEALYDMGCFQPIELELYKEYYDFNLKIHATPVMTGYIYIQKPPELCLETILSDKSHIGIELSYLEKLHEKNELLFNNGVNDLVGNAPVVIVQHDEDFEIVISKINTTFNIN
tara:strand:+ start:2514 stop:3155 length:642 start_codon:yes stop_codon:yes gene_type:complete